MAWTLKPGDRIRLRATTASGFNGHAIVLSDHPDGLLAWRPESSTDPGHIGIALRSQVAKCRDQQAMEGFN